MKTLPDDLLDERVVGVHKAKGGDVGATVSEVLQVHQVQILHHVLFTQSSFLLRAKLQFKEKISPGKC